jgi:hypothetical protein
MKTFPENLFSIRPLMGMASLALLLSAAAETPCGNGGITEDEDCEECDKSCADGESGNDSRSEYGPIMKIPLGGSGMPPKTKQTFFQTNGSNGISKALDLEIESTTSLLPLKFERMYQSRIREGTGEVPGTPWVTG